MVNVRGTSPRFRNSTALKFHPKKLSPHTIAFYIIILFGFSVFLVFFFARNVLEDEHQPHFTVDSQFHQITDELWEAPGNYSLHQCVQPSSKYKGFSLKPGSLVSISPASLDRCRNQEIQFTIGSGHEWSIDEATLNSALLKGLVEVFDRLEEGKVKEDSTLTSLVRQMHKNRQGAPRKREGAPLGIKGRARSRMEESFYENPYPEYGKVMMEYIGATGVPVKFDSVPVEEGIDFHFLLSFAIDADSLGNPQNGTFAPYWASTLTPASVAKVKSRHPNVKVLASLSGWSLGDKVLRWYDPKDTHLWISNAFSSLQSIVDTYHLDGIDIDYENFPRHNSTFAYCIGELITYLKNQSVISTATIAPYYLTVKPYIELYNGYGNVIDYANHQFYTDKISTPQGYLEDFKLRIEQFNESKLLPAYEVNGRGIQGDAFFEALNLLESNGLEVNGVMIFSADASQPNGFYYEKKSQEFLLNSTSV
ncbi:Glycoside hydrolase family 18, catalytic domain [Dillenia turbinata]|uniref:Glycoside hydrolase family 18, catalytic domain n=1 Tax=Dillenia turbinata TaxID=194707 RepID=A0AAN8V3U1_9MAGN